MSFLIFILFPLLVVSGVLVFIHSGRGPGLTQEEKKSPSFPYIVFFGKAGNRRNY